MRGGKTRMMMGLGWGIGAGNMSIGLAMFNMLIVSIIIFATRNVLGWVSLGFFLPCT